MINLNDQKLECSQQELELSEDELETVSGGFIFVAPVAFIAYKAFEPELKPIVDKAAKKIRKLTKG